jgi:predicted transcriptional regulator
LGAFSVLRREGCQLNEGKAEFLKKGSHLSNYSALPNEIYKMNISSTAMILYAKLLNRAQLSVSNDFLDEVGRAYVIYTLEELAEELHKSVSAIKNNMQELIAVGLIEKRRSDRSRANMIFVKIPTSSLTESKGQNIMTKQAENEPFNSSKTIPYRGRKMAANNYKEKQIPNYEYAEGESL